MRVETRKYTPSDWSCLSGFIREHWAARHPMLDRELFEWQYAGFGPDGNRPESETRLAFDGDKLLGFLGLIPCCYQVAGRDRAEIVEGVAVAMWMVHPDYRGSGLGVLLLDQAERSVDAIHCLGANADAASYYVRRGYSQYKRLTR